MSHAAWKKQENFAIKLLSDFNRTMLRGYKSMYEDFRGFKRIAKRSVHVVGTDGKIAYSWATADAGELPDVQKALEAVRKLQGAKRP